MVCRRWTAWQMGVLTFVCVCSVACGSPKVTAHPGEGTAATSVATAATPPTSSASATRLPQTATPLPTRSITATPTPRATPAATPIPTSPNQDFINRAIARTNSYRQQHGCAPLAENTQLDQAALGHSQDMAIHSYFAHNSPSGQTPWDRIHAAGYRFRSAAENIAAGYTTPEEVIDAFYNEQPPNDGHRLNLLNCGLHDVGIGYYFLATSPYRTYWTQDFGTR